MVILCPARRRAMAALRPAIPAPITRILRGVWEEEGDKAEGILRVRR